MHNPNKIMWYDTAGCWDTMRIYKAYKAMNFKPGQMNGKQWSEGVEYLDLPNNPPVGYPVETATTTKNNYPTGADGSTVNWGTSLEF